MTDPTFRPAGTPTLSRARQVAGWLLLTLLLLGCGMCSGGGIAQRPTSVGTPDPQRARLAQGQAGWACPTNTPQPYGAAGPVKRTYDCHCDTDPDTGAEDCDTCQEHYEKWEQEYGHLGDPAPAPTTYTREARLLGERVNLTDLDVVIDAAPVAPAADADLPPGMALYRLTASWDNQGEAIPFDPIRQLAITTITRPDGRRVGGRWVGTPKAARLADSAVGTSSLTTTLPRGPSTTELAVLAPAGVVQEVELRLDGSATDPALREAYRVALVAGRDPHCRHSGVRGHGPRGPTRLRGSPDGGASEVVARALTQLGRSYCWGGKGYTPCAGGGPGNDPPCPAPGRDLPCFDCSGLTWWAWNEVGVAIGYGTAAQQHLPRVAQLQPGDLLLYGTPISHVSLYAGDLDGDGRGDAIDAANHPTGVVLVSDVFNAPWYRVHFRYAVRPVGDR